LDEDRAFHSTLGSLLLCERRGIAAIAAGGAEHGYLRRRGVPCGAPVASGEAVAVLRPQLGSPVFAGELSL
jgi:hypothetical protein